MAATVQAEETTVNASTLAAVGNTRMTPRLTAGLLTVACALGIAVRLFPLVAWARFGSDTGEYFYLTERLLDTGILSFDYAGWGLAYPYFPGLFTVSGMVAATTGMNLLDALSTTIPFVAGILIPLGTYVAARTITGDDRAAMFAAFAVAVLAPNVVTTNHAMPGTLGQFLIIATVAVLARAYDDARWAAALPFLGAAILFSHHLSTFLLAGIVLAAAFLREWTSPRTDWRKLAIEAPFVLGLATGASWWWLSVAHPLRDQIIGQVVSGVSPWVIAIGSWVALLIPVGLVILRRRMVNPRNRLAPGRTVPRRFPGPRLATGLAAGTFTALVVTLLYVMGNGVPGTPDMKVGWVTFTYLITPFAVVAFTGPGFLAARFLRHRHLALGWITALMTSFTFGVITESQTLIPYRHVDYIIVALAVFAGIGFALVHDYLRAVATPARRVHVQRGAIALAVLLVVSGTALSQVPREAIAGFEEGISESAWGGIEWARANLAGELVPYGEPGTTVIAADHPASSFLWGYAKVPATFDYAKWTYHAEVPEDAFEEMWRVQAPPPPSSTARIDYVFVSPEIRGGVALLQWENARPMSEASMRKFYDSPYYTSVYPEAGCDEWPRCFDPDATQIFRVRWDHILADWTPPAP